METIRASDVGYLPPGHRFEVVADTEGIEFSPTHELRRQEKVVARHLQREE
jgi:hypothetical protein